MKKLSAIVVSIVWLLAGAAASHSGEWVSTGLTGGSVRKIVAASPAGATLYAAAGLNGVYKSRNGGKSWSPANAGLVGTGISQLAVDPSDPETLYAGGGAGFYRSFDGGKSWERTERTRIDAIVVDPSTTSTVYVGAREGVLRSTDQAATWETISEGLPEDPDIGVLAISPADPSTLFASIRFDKGLYRTVDAGVTWERADDGLVPTGGLQGVLPALLDADLVHVAMSRGIARSTDRGESWERISDLPAMAGLAEDPQTSEVLYAVKLNTNTHAPLYRSVDGGISWAPFGPSLGDMERPRHLSFENLAIGQLQTIHVSSPCGALRLADPVSNWGRSRRGKGLPITTLALAADPSRDGLIYAGTACGRFKSKNGGRTRRRLPDPFRASTSSLAVDPNRPRTLFAGTNRGLFKSRDGGRTWKRLRTGNSGVAVAQNSARIVVDPHDSNRLWASSIAGLVRSQDGGESWSEVRPGRRVSRVTEVLIDHADESIVYLTTDRGILKSKDGGLSWKKKNRGLPSKRVSGLAMDPNDHRVLYSGSRSFEAGVFKSIDGGQNWQPALRGIAGPRRFVRQILVDPVDSSTLHAATSDGVFLSEDGGANWRLLGEPGELANTLTLALSGSTLYAGGSTGVFRLK